jgi:S-(hydroxymethyl)glutathione dehydrogenase / alcohol dehydrogenase
VTRRGGRATVVGLGPSTAEVTFNALEIAFLARTLAGCMYGNTDPAADVPILLDHYRAGRLDLEALVSRTATLDEVGSAFADMESGTGVRTLLTFPD